MFPIKNPRCRRWAVISLLVAPLCATFGIRPTTYHDHDGGTHAHDQPEHVNHGDHDHHRQGQAHSHVAGHTHSIEHGHVHEHGPPRGHRGNVSNDREAERMGSANLAAGHPHTHFTFFGFELTVFDHGESGSRFDSDVRKHEFHVSRILMRVLEIRSPIPPAHVSIFPPLGSIAPIAFDPSVDGRERDAPVSPPPEFVSAC